MEESNIADAIELPLHTANAPAAPIANSNVALQTPRWPAQRSSPEPVPNQTLFPSPSRYLELVGRGRCYRTKSPMRLNNSLLASVGFLEAANAGDFAANVWNNTPVPTYAVVLMAIGGAVALGITIFAAKDAILSWRNIRGLRSERRYLKRQGEEWRDNAHMRRTIACLLDMNFRETGTEWVDRVGMDVLMGFGALMIGVGTILAIFGSNPAAFRASNLLSGYVGNVPCCIYGLANSAWSLYVWRRAFRHGSARFKSCCSARTSLRISRRTSSVKLHGALNGVVGVVAGVASLVTATMWWGYVLLAPCVVTAAVANFLWRHRIGYTRPFVQRIVPLDEDMIEAELNYVEARQRQTEKSTCQKDVFVRLVSNPTSLACTLDFLSHHDLLEDFCLRTLADTQLGLTIGDVQGETVTFRVEKLAALDAATHDRLLEIARSIVAENVRKHFLERERYLLEVLGCYLCTPLTHPSTL